MSRPARRLIAVLVLALVHAAPVVALTPRPTLDAQINRLVLAPERPSGYRRALFPHWDRATGTCSVREQVLRSESVTPAVVDPSTCSVRYGTWYSTYDGVTLTDPTRIDIDHVVALKEAWDSGAHAWTPARRRAFANDLTDPISLAAVSSISNREKSDKDPAGWMPVPAARCGYLSAWVGIKLRWSLSVDKNELAAIRAHAAACPGASNPTKTSTPPSPSTQPTLVPFFANCAAARAAGAAPLRRGEAGYRAALDGDGDGIACE